jgi:predicted aldo/keto reductase-like oxidoreductase
MRYSRFGHTELQMPAITCGGMRYQQSWNADEEISDESQANVEACIRRALEGGVNHIETARGYGTSEKQLGRILPALPRDEILVQTKVGPCDDPAEFRRSFEDSLARLRLDYVDLLGIHGINDDASYRQAINLGTVDMARQFVAEGKVRFVGFSSHGDADIITKLVETDRFDYVNLHYFYINQEKWRAIEAAERLDMGVFIISPCDKGGKLYEPPSKLVELCKPLTPMQFNDLWTLSSGKVHTLSIGPSRPSDLDEHIATIDEWDKVSDVVMQVAERLNAEMERVLGAEWVASWDRNLPKWHDAPGQMNLPVILGLWNVAKAFDMVEFARMRYNLMGNGGSWFPGYKADRLARGEVSEDQLVDALRDHADPRRVIEAIKEAEQLLGGEERKRLSQGG